MEWWSIIWECFAQHIPQLLEYDALALDGCGTNLRQSNEYPTSCLLRPGANLARPAQP